QKHWGQADNYDADSANNRWVRGLMVRRSRYEAANNGYVDGIQTTHATFVVRKGPRLRILTETEEEAREGSPENIRNEQIKRDWRAWCKRIKFRRKLWTMAHAKIQDGEPIAVVRFNPKVKHRVKLDVGLIETEQCQTPLLPQGAVGYIDGVRFDPWGNPIYYDILPRHPGAMGLNWPMTPDHVPAKYVLHWFTAKRPNQHRKIPEMSSVLGLGAIVYEIIARIKESRFVVADVTQHRNGVYFEGGYAMGMGLPVIWMCHQDDLQKTHFDTSHLNHIVWSDTAELRKNLANRILATIGRGPLKKRDA
ncbi:MAG: phage portal protein, partial [Planctomycetota bacterium]|nr:phage portal protein [Planctomycetota bacterium]